MTHRPRGQRERRLWCRNWIVTHTGASPEYLGTVVDRQRYRQRLRPQSRGQSRNCSYTSTPALVFFLTDSHWTGSLVSLKTK